MFLGIYVCLSIVLFFEFFFKFKNMFYKEENLCVLKMVIFFIYLILRSIKIIYIKIIEINRRLRILKIIK